jgi:hypothetical protein
MFRTLVVVAALAGAVVLGASAPAMAAGGGGCQLDGDAAFAPPLSSTAQDFAYSFHGDLTGCNSTIAGSPATGTVAAGEVWTDPLTGQRFQEPGPTGNGSCGSSTTQGIGIITWADGTTTVLQYTTTGAAAAVSLDGTVIPSVTLPAINPQIGQPTETTVTSTRYAGFTSKGLLAFEPPDPTACAPGAAGVSSAGISGFTGLGSSS